MVRIPVLENRAVRCGAVRILSSRKPAVRFGAVLSKVKSFVALQFGENC